MEVRLELLLPGSLPEQPEDRVAAIAAEERSLGEHPDPESAERAAVRLLLSRDDGPVDSI